MRFCCNDSGIDVTRPAEELEPRFKQLREIGFHVIGIGGAENVTDDQIKRFLDLAAKYDIVVGMSPTGYQPAHPDPIERKRNQEGLKKTLVNMRKLGGDLIHICGGSYAGDGWWQHPKNFTQEGMDELVEETKKMAPYAEDANVCICPETTQWCIIQSPERMKEYVDRIGSPCVKVTFDIVNHMRPDRIYDSGRFAKCVFALLGDRIGQLHVKDVAIKSGLVVHIDETQPGTGLLDHATLIKLSDELEPWKTYSLEHFNWGGTWYDMVQQAYRHNQDIADRIGHTWSDPHLTREVWARSQSR